MSNETTLMMDLVNAQQANQKLMRIIENLKPTDLRDQFAMAALTGYITHFGVIGGLAPSDEDFARWSYDLADAMLKVRGE